MEGAPKQEDIGRVSDPKLAQEMAEIENYYHKKTLGVFPPSEGKIAKGRQAAEQYRLHGVEIAESELPPKVLEVIKEYKDEQKEACKGGKWRITNFFRVDPLIGENITTYKIEGVVDIHDDRGNWLQGDSGNIVIKTDGESVVEIDKKDFMTRCVEHSTGNYGGRGKSW
jgi:hypothetical protein